MILAGRRINDGMAEWVALDVIRTMLRRKIEVGNARALVLGLTFKENCPDIRNTKVVDLIRELESFVHEVTVYDPFAHADEVLEEYRFELAEEMPKGPFELILIAVGHDEFKKIEAESLRGMLAWNGILYDLKQVLPTEASDARV